MQNNFVLRPLYHEWLQDVLQIDTVFGDAEMFTIVSVYDNKYCICIYTGFCHGMMNLTYISKITEILI